MGFETPFIDYEKQRLELTFEKERKPFIQVTVKENS